MNWNVEFCKPNQNKAPFKEKFSKGLFECSDDDRIGEGYANLLETSVLSVSKSYQLVWNKTKLDLQELAVKRWVERWSVDRITAHFDYGRTAVVRKLGRLKRNPELILDGKARSHAKSRKRRFMGRS